MIDHVGKVLKIGTIRSLIKDSSGRFLKLDTFLKDIQTLLDKDLLEGRILPDQSGVWIEWTLSIQEYDRNAYEPREDGEDIYGDAFNRAQNRKILRVLRDHGIWYG